MRNHGDGFDPGCTDLAHAGVVEVLDRVDEVRFGRSGCSLAVLG